MKTYTAQVNLRKGTMVVSYMVSLKPKPGKGYNGGRGEVVIDVPGMEITQANENILDQLPSTYFTNRKCPLNFEFDLRSNRFRDSKNVARNMVRNRLKGLVPILVKEGVIKFIS